MPPPLERSVSFAPDSCLRVAGLAEAHQSEFRAFAHGAKAPRKGVADLEQVLQCEQMLLYLTEDTWTCGQARARAAARRPMALLSLLSRSASHAHADARALPWRR